MANIDSEIEQKPTIIHWVQYVTIICFGRFIAMLPASIGMNIGAVLGLLCYYVAPFRKKVALENLKIAFGNSMSLQERKRIMRAAYQAFAFQAVESCYCYYASPNWPMSRLKEIVGREHVESIEKDKEPVIAVAAHYGAWEVLGQIASNLFPELTSLAKPLRNPLLQKLIRDGRERRGLKILWTDNEKMSRELISILKDPEQNIAILADQDNGIRGVFPEFFTQPASTTPSPASLALRVKRPILTFHLTRIGVSGYRLELHPLIRPEDAKGETQDEKILWITQQFVSRLEDTIRLHPGQYFWFHRRWKTTQLQAKKRLWTLEQRRRERQAARRTEESA